MSTPYHAKYFANEINARRSSDDIGKFAATLADAQVDLNPHQIDAALFAFRSPLSKGAILADEVGLGKTIEAGILLSQKWAERKRRLLIIVPASLRKQWHQELDEKFFLPSVILEKKSFEAGIAAGNLNPFDDPSRIVICSYHFARAKEPYLSQTSWDLVVIDEAHRLRNVYKPTNRIANSIKNALANTPKILLTATPLQNSLVELYGLVSIIDEYGFGDLASFKAQYSDLNGEQDFKQLRERLKPLCQRTLRRQVLEYVPFTNRISITQEFTPSVEEQSLYDQVSDYLRQDELFALPKGQRKLMTLIMRKLLASSTFAISGTLKGLANKLENALRANLANSGSAVPLVDHFEPWESLQEEWVDDDEEAEEETKEIAEDEHIYSADEARLVREEIEQLKGFERLATSIVKNAKGEVLLIALEKGFVKARELGAPTKAVIFTESRRTQEYLQQVLESSNYRGKTVLFNGTNANEQAREIYHRWKVRHQGTAKISGSRTADTRQALVDYFKETADILIATEAAAEGINLQFCNMVVNYDMPWNPQRVEQRIGRCHRYGQKFDVVVVNFLNNLNAADQYVYQLLSEKFKLFEGVFGASDEVLGSIASGVDFEKQISDIMQNCRTPEEIQEGFQNLRDRMEVPIEERMGDTRQKLLEHFDVEVHEKLRVKGQLSGDALNRFETWLWEITRYYLRDFADFRSGEKGFSFVLNSNPFPEEAIEAGPYRSGKNVETAYLYRTGHPMAQKVIQACMLEETKPVELTFDLSGNALNIAAVEPLKGQRGWLCVEKFTISALETEDHLLFACVRDDGEVVDGEQARRLFNLSASTGGEVDAGDAPDALSQQFLSARTQVMGALEKKNSDFFEIELNKLDLWADDQKQGLEFELKEIDRSIKETRRMSFAAQNLEEKLVSQKQLRNLEGERHRKRKDLFAAQDAIEAKRTDLIEELEKRLQRKQESERLFTVRWAVV